MGNLTAIGSQCGSDPSGCSKCTGFPSRRLPADCCCVGAAMVRKSGFHVLRSAQKDQAMSAVVCGLPTRTGLHNGLAWQLCALGCNCPQSQRPREVCRRPPIVLTDADSHSEGAARKPAGRGEQLGDAWAEAMHRKATSGSISQASLERRPRTWLGLSVDDRACSSDEFLSVSSGKEQGPGLVSSS